MCCHSFANFSSSSMCGFNVSNNCNFSFLIIGFFTKRCNVSDLPHGCIARAGTSRLCQFETVQSRISLSAFFLCRPLPHPRYIAGRKIYATIAAHLFVGLYNLHILPLSLLQLPTSADYSVVVFSELLTWPPLWVVVPVHFNLAGTISWTMCIRALGHACCGGRL